MKRLPIEACVPSLEVMSGWIVGTYNSAPDEAREIGATWYSLAHDYALTISPKSIRIGAGVIAALSPQKSWSENKRLAKACIRGGRVNGQTQANIDKALAIAELGHDPLDVLKSDDRSWKAWSFYKLIRDPSDSSTVCVDRHAFDIATERARLINPDLPFVTSAFLNRKGGYALISDAYRLASLELECLPHQVQATTWIHWRQSKRPNPSSFSEPF